MDGFPAKWPLGAWIHGHIRPPDGRQYSARVDGGHLQGRISVHGADSEQMQSGMLCGEEDSKCILSRNSD